MRFSSRTMVLAALRFAAITVLLVAGTRLIPGCSNGPSDLTSVSKTPGGPTGPGESCTHPAPGCGCSQSGATAPCGNVELKSGTSVVCSEGTTTCDGTKWGACQGDITVTTSSISGGSLRLLSLGASSTCGSGGVPADPCDPYCNGFPGTGGGFDASPLVAGEGGLTIPTGPGACMCNEPAQPAALAGAITVSGLPSPCTGSNDAGMGTDNCNEDYVCVNGTCQPYAAAGVNLGCQAAPDYTLGLGCNDGTGWQLTLCNRGYVPSPGVGQLYIAIGGGTPNPAPDPGTCPWPTGPTLPMGAASENGQCIINLTTTTITPGACINIDVPTQCTELDGVTPLTALNAQHHWAMVNPPASILAASTPIPECDTCNNYTGLEKGEIGPNSACVNTNCGTTCGGGTDAGVDGGSGCHTYVTGTVYDPGANIPLPGVDIYQITALADLPTFADAPACDTCTSVLPPAGDIVSSTGSAIDGTFALEVNGTTGIPVVFQTGRWVRAITIGTDTPALTACAQNNITVPADCTWPGAACKTRLPQTQAEGHIPKTAVLTGGAEPFDCSIEKFMGGTTEGSAEMGTGNNSSGQPYRIQLFNDNGNSKVQTPAVLVSGNSAAISAPPSASGAGWIMQGAAGSTITITNLSTVPPLNGSNWSSTAGGAAQTINGLTGILPAYVGGQITLWGSSGNMTGNWTILSQTATSVTINNPGGSAKGANGNHHWAVNEPTGPLTPAASWVGGSITLSGAQFNTNDGTFTIATVPSNSSVTLINTTNNFPDGNSGESGPNSKNPGTGMLWTANQAGGVTLTGLAGMIAGYVGDTITITGATQPGNNGAFTIASYISPTSIAISNPTAVAEPLTPAIHWVISAPSGAINLPASSGVWPLLTGYNQVIAGCDHQNGHTATIGGGNQTDAYTFIESGGKMFVNHWAALGLFWPNAAGAGGNASGVYNTGTLATWGNGNNSPQSNAMTGQVAPGGMPNAGQQQFLTWLQNEGAYSGGGGCAAGTGLCTPNPVDDEAVSVGANGFEWLRGACQNCGNNGGDDWGGNPTGNYTLMYSFDSNATGPVPTLSADGGPGGGCGRTIVSDMHVNTSRGGTNGTIGGPGGGTCNLGPALSANEAAFEYLFFELSACNVGGAPIKNSAPPAPPPPAMLMPTTITLTYQASCPAGTGPVWGFFEWQATIPMGTNITFQAQTAPAADGGGPGTYGPIVPIGEAQSTTTGWTVDGCPVQGHLQDLKAYGNNPACAGSTPDSAQTSQEYLEVSITFNPAGTVAPVLTQWDQLYDCVPNQ